MEEWAIIFKNRVVQRFTIDEDQCLIIGRGSDANVVIDNKSISRKHCSLEFKNGAYFITDWHSMNGTRVDGKKIVAEMPIMKSSLLEIGRFILKPANLLTDEKEGGSTVVDSTDNEDHNLTLSVSGIYKDKNNIDETTEGPAKGYRLLTVLEGAAAPSKVALKKLSVVKAGKEPSCQLILTGGLIGKVQFTIAYRQGGYYISHKGGILKKTSVNGQKVKEDRKLLPMDIIEVGNAKIRFS
jgi:pSer/pThr/pTyr-binding forkhead associated (FHA) protein